MENRLEEPKCSEARPAHPAEVFRRGQWAHLDLLGAWGTGRVAEEAWTRKAALGLSQVGRERTGSPRGGPASPQLSLWAEFPQTAETHMEMNQT